MASVVEDRHRAPGFRELSCLLLITSLLQPLDLNRHVRSGILDENSGFKAWKASSISLGCAWNDNAF
jgi:hypothetical protein